MTFNSGSRISGRGFKFIKVWRLALLVFSSFSETKLFHFHRIFKNGGRGGDSSKTPDTPPDPPLTLDLMLFINKQTTKLGLHIVFILVLAFFF